ncbi:MAG: methyl-accepting chemotaxis protein [Veillonellales bacterium]
MSIRTKMILVFSAIAAIIVLAAASAGYFFTKDRLTENIEKQMTATASAHVNKLDGWLIGKEKVVENTAGTIQSAAGNGQVPASLLAGYKNVDQDLNDVYFGSAEGKLVSGSGWVPSAGFDPRTRIWYKEAIQQKRTVFTDPYVDEETQKLEVSAALPVWSPSGQIRGVVSSDIMLNTLVDIVRDINLDGHGYAFLTDRKGFILAHPDAAVLGKNIFEIEKLKDIAGVAKEIQEKEQGFQYFKENGTDMIMVYKQIPSTHWTLCINVDQAVVFQPLVYLRELFIAIALVSILLVIGVTFIVARRITGPLEKLEQQVALLANGDLTVQAEVQGEDEISRLAAGFNKMVGDLREMLNDIYHSTVQLQGSSNKLIDIASTVAANSQEMSATVGMVSASVEQISAGTEENASSTEQASHSVESVSLRAKEMSSAAKKAAEASESVERDVKEVSTVINEVSQSIQQVSVFAQEVASSCKHSIAITAEAKIRSQETNDMIQRLSASSKQISKIVAVIRNIAEQTNMLALNATIEAAGAGEAGKGFAVVAGEVKELSKRTTEEAGRIGQQIEEMQNDMGEAVTVVGKITEVIAETMDITQTIAAAVGEPATEGTEKPESSTGDVTTISREVTAIADKTQRVSQNAAEAAGGVEAMVHTNAEISQKADEVARSMGEMESIMNNISQATQEIAKGTQDISLSMQETDKAIGDTATKASQVSESAHESGELANQLKELIGRFKA